MGDFTFLFYYPSSSPDSLLMTRLSSLAADSNCLLCRKLRLPTVYNSLLCLHIWIIERWLFNHILYINIILSVYYYIIYVYKAAFRQSVSKSVSVSRPPSHRMFVHGGHDWLVEHGGLGGHGGLVVVTIIFWQYGFDSWKLHLSLYH